MRTTVDFYLNGKLKSVGAESASMMLADYLRLEQGLVGTKIVCAEGDCGACCVLRLDAHSPETNFLSVNSCITLVAQLDGATIVTVDALKNKDEFHVVQKAMIQCHGSQCGFCTPGFVMTLAGKVEEKITKKENNLNVSEAKNCLTGNLCRCTGYQPIIDAAISMDLKNVKSLKERFATHDQLQYLQKIKNESVELNSDEFNYCAPTTINEAIQYLQKNPETRILGSTTDLGVIHNKRKIILNKALSLHLIKELNEIKVLQDEIHIGARVSLARFREFIKDKLPEFSNYLDVFASPQIKNTATVIGNIANASPIGETPPAFLVLNAQLHLEGAKGRRIIPLSDFFLGYRKTALLSGEIITHLSFRIPQKDSSLRLYKNANRKDLDISAVNLAIKLDWNDSSKTQIKDLKIAAGGVAAIPLRLKKVEQFFLIHPLNAQNIDQALNLMQTEFIPLSDVRASSTYRRILVENFLKKSLMELGGLT